MADSRPIVAVTRVVPGRVEVPAAVVVPYGRLRSRRSASGGGRTGAVATAALVVGSLAALGITTAVLFAAPQMAILGMASLTVAAVLLLPLALHGLLALLERLTYRWRDAAPFIAAR